MTAAAALTSAARPTWRRRAHRSVGSFRVETFSARWAVYLIARFDSDAHAARALEVSAETVRRWRKQQVAPGGAVVAFVFANDPAAIPYLTGAADALD